MFTSAAARHEVLEESNWGRAAVSECSNVLPFFHLRLVIVAGGIWTYMAGRIEVAGRQAGRHTTVVVVRFISRTTMRNGKDDATLLQPVPLVI